MKTQKQQKRAQHTPNTESIMADTMQSAAARLEIHISHVRKAKNEGCGAFRNGRVNLPELMAWLMKRHAPPSEAKEDDPSDTDMLESFTAKDDVSFNWSRRREWIFALTENIEGAYLEGGMDFPTYRRAIVAAVEAGKILNEAWGAGVDCNRWTAIWLCKVLTPEEKGERLKAESVEDSMLEKLQRRFMHELARRCGAPRPTACGRHDVKAWREFMKKEERWAHR